MIKYHKYIDDYIQKIESGKIKSSKRIKKALLIVKNKLDDTDIFIDSEKIEDAVRIIEKFFKLKLLDWQLFIITLVHCYYESTDMVVFAEFLILMGRGNGKNGFISMLSWYLTTPNHGIDRYHIDIIANSEEQAKTSFNDIYEMLDIEEDLKDMYYKTKTEIECLATKSLIKFNTSNARTKDGKRSACLIFDEIHEYEDYELIKVFTSGFGKNKHARTFFISTNGYLRNGVLDMELEQADLILDGEIKDLRTLPLIYEVDDEKEVADLELWEKANPSINHLPILKSQIESDFIKIKYNPELATDFYTKRMNLPRENPFLELASWDKIKATNKEIPFDDLKGKTCIGAIDYAQINDFASCGLLFKQGEKRYFIEHTFVCHHALKIESRRIKFPVEEMVDRGLITIAYSETIEPRHLAEWFLEQASDYYIQDIVADSYRIEYIKKEFEEKGLPISMVRSGPITHGKISHLLSSLFANENIVFGDNPTMRWYTNNTYQEIDKKGNITYKKVEPRTRKTDGFFALVHALAKDNELESFDHDFEFLDAIIF